MKYYIDQEYLNKTEFIEAESYKEAWDKIGDLIGLRCEKDFED